MYEADFLIFGFNICVLSPRIHLALAPHLFPFYHLPTTYSPWTHALFTTYVLRTHYWGGFVKKRSDGGGFF